MSKPNWGLLPSDIKSLLRKREWDKHSAFKERFKNQKPFPIEIGLKPPLGKAVLDSIEHFQLFVASWKQVSPPFKVKWEHRNYKHISEQYIPIKLVIDDMNNLAQWLGETEKLLHWQSKIDFILSSLSASKELFDVLVDYLDVISDYQQYDLDLLVSLIPQLKEGLGTNNYLRALPVSNVDTKFIENNFKLIEAMTDIVNAGSVKPIGLLSWLGCYEKPKDWLLIRPLCDNVQQKLGRLPLLRLSTETLLKYELPAKRILVVENEQSCLALPSIENTIAVSGGGKNVVWLDAQWISTKHIAYWGDIDSEGLNILSNVRSKVSWVVPLMMDEPTINTFKDRMVPEPESIKYEPPALSADEKQLFRLLRSDAFTHSRLEQERIPLDYVQGAINVWLD